MMRNGNVPLQMPDHYPFCAGPRPFLRPLCGGLAGWPQCRLTLDLAHSAGQPVPRYLIDFSSRTMKSLLFVLMDNVSNALLHLIIRLLCLCSERPRRPRPKPHNEIAPSHG